MKIKQKLSYQRLLETTFNQNYTKKIVKFFIIFFAVFFYCTTSIFSYENQHEGFKKINNDNGKISFECEKQCIYFLGPKQNNDFVEINGKINGNGLIGYGFINGNKIIPGEFFKIEKKQDFNKKLRFHSLNYYSQLHDKIQVVLVINGNIYSNNFNSSLGKTSTLDSIILGWNDFWKMESLTPYSINLRYGVKITGTSIIKYAYILFIFLFIISMFFKKYRKIETFLILGLILYMFIGFRNLITYSYITKTGLTNYTYSNYEDKTFFDLGDYLVFTDKVLNKVEKNKNFNIYMESFQNWPFKSHMSSVYMKPCNFIENIKDANYAIFYKKPYNDIGNSEILINYNNSYLLKLNK